MTRWADEVLSGMPGAVPATSMNHPLGDVERLAVAAETATRITGPRMITGDGDGLGQHARGRLLCPHWSAKMWTP